MYSYIALLWDSSFPDARDGVSLLAERLQSLHRPWKLDATARGVQIWSTDSKTRSPKTRTLRGLNPIPGPTGVLLGTIFRRADSDSSCPPTPLEPSDSESEKIALSRGRWLVDFCWGDYVALIWDSARPGVVVVKDPTGTLPCFITTFRGITVAFSRVSDWMAAAPVSLTVNWSYVRERVVRNDLDSGIDSLVGILQVRRGECVELARGATAIKARSYHWTPFSFPRRGEAIDRVDTAVALVRSTVLSTTLAWARCHDSILHRLSGGLDSSVILGCLATSPNRPVITAHTYYHPGGRSDERPWAALAAQTVGCKHRYSPLAPERCSLDGLLLLPPSNEPLSMLFGHLHIEPLERRLADEAHATALFTGDGGDAIFGRLAVAFAADDHIQRYGYTFGAIDAAYQAALCKDLTTWSVLRQCLGRLSRSSTLRDQRARLAQNTTLIDPALRESWLAQREFPHPWFRPTFRIPWTQIFLLATLLIPSESYRMLPDLETPEPETVYPFHSQPLVELCLRIPTRFQLANGFDRALVRTAFAAEIPDKIRRRCWKDNVPSFFEVLVQRNRDFLREFLLNGILVREGILIRERVEAALSGAPSKQQATCVELLLHVSTEAWLRFWTAHS